MNPDQASLAWVCEVVARHYADRANGATPAITGSQAVFLFTPKSPGPPAVLRIASFENPFGQQKEHDQRPPLHCFHLVSVVDLFRAVMTRSPELVTAALDELELAYADHWNQRREEGRHDEDFD